MLARRLDYSPKAEEIAITVNVMVDDLRTMGLCEHDSPRVLKAFQDYALEAKRWPTTAKIKEHLPPPTVRPKITQKKAPPKIINDYMTKHNLHGASKEKCMQHLKDIGMIDALPKSLRK